MFQVFLEYGHTNPYPNFFFEGIPLSYYYPSPFGAAAYFLGRTLMLSQFPFRYTLFKQLLLDFFKNPWSFNSPVFGGKPRGVKLITGFITAKAIGSQGLLSSFYLGRSSLGFPCPLNFGLHWLFAHRAFIALELSQSSTKLTVPVVGLQPMLQCQVILIPILIPTLLLILLLIHIPTYYSNPYTYP